MTKYPTLSKAPIFQVLFQVRFKSEKEVSNIQLKSLHKKIISDFPLHEEEARADININRNALNQTSLSLKGTRVLGQRFLTENRDLEIFISNDTYTFTQRSNYTTWENLKTKAFKYLKLLWSGLKIVEIQRCSLRYLNNIIIESNDEIIGQESLFNTFIGSKIVQENPSPFGKYSLSYQTKLRDDLSVNFAQQYVPSENKGTFSFVIDIDVLNYQIIASNDFEKVESNFEELRNVKNDYFFKNLTEYTLNTLK